MQNLHRPYKQTKFWDMFTLVEAHKPRSLIGVYSAHLPTIRWRSPMLIDWVIIQKHIAHSLPAVHKYNQMQEGHAQITAITLVQDWSFCSDWENAILGSTQSVLRVIFDETDPNNFNERGDYANGRVVAKARKYYALMWNVMLYSGCYSNQWRIRRNKKDKQHEG